MSDASSDIIAGILGVSGGQRLVVVGYDCCGYDGSGYDSCGYDSSNFE